MSKAHPDINDTLRTEGADRVRARHDTAQEYTGNSRGRGKTSGREFLLKPFDAIMLSTAPNYLIKGILPRAGLAVVWGPPKCGKSFWTFDLMMHVALGWRYRGRRVQQGAVVYLALEGGHGFRARVEAWRRRHLGEHRECVPFYLLDLPVDLVADRDRLIQTIKAQCEQRPVAIVIDTLNRALIGDENKSDDMAKFIRAADIVRATFNCLVLVIHHCGIQKNRPRGHTSLSGADDAQIAVARDDDSNIIVKIEHMKDGDASAPMASRLERIELGTDDDGDPITSCIIVPAEVGAAQQGPKLPATAKLALDLLRALVATDGNPPAPGDNIPTNARPVSAVAWRDRFYNAYPTTKPDTKQKAYVRAVLKLQEKKLIEIWSTYVWLVSEPDKPDIRDS